jgi:hypothetical protein
MNEIKLSEAEIKMIELKREEERIEKEKQEIESQIKYQKEIEHYKKAFLNEIEECKNSFENISKVYNKFVEDGLGKYLKLTTSVSYRSFELPSYSNFELKEEDKIENVETTFARIDFSTNVGSIWKVTNDLRFELPWLIAKRYSNYSYKTALAKIKEFIEDYNEKQITKRKEEKVKLDLKAYFLELDPNCSIKESTEWQKGWGKGEGYDLLFLEVTFKNTNYIKIKYYSDGSWSIVKQIDNRLPKDKFEIVQNLAK